MKRREILGSFGVDGITDYAPVYGGLGKVTDDTQMTLFTAEGLLRGWVRGCFRGIAPNFRAVVARAYQRWLVTQGEAPGFDINLDHESGGWLFEQPELHRCRAPGNTCLAALRTMHSAGEAAENDSKGCGGVMRVAPVGLFAARVPIPADDTFHLAIKLAALTHGHPSGQLPAGVLAVLILALAEGTLLSDGLTGAKALLRLEPHFEETMEALEEAEDLAAGDVPPEMAIRRLGAGWVAEEALAIAVYCALKAQSFRHGVILAVNHDGDSDSTGAIAGNLLGAIHGVSAIPSEWLERLELRTVITEIADDLFAFRNWDIGEHSPDRELNERIWHKYPGC